MRIKLSELRSVIRNVIKEAKHEENDVEASSFLYGAPTEPQTVDGEIKFDGETLPKGMNSRSKENMKEAFVRPTSAELTAWAAGDYEFDPAAEENVEVVSDPCDCCGEMFPSTQIKMNDEGAYVCSACHGQ